MSVNYPKEMFGKRIDLKFSEFVPAVPEKQYVDCCIYDICLKDGKAIGTISAKLGFNESVFYIGNIGYSINEEYRGNGYAGEAVEVIKELFKNNGFDKVYITQNPENLASKRVCEKLNAKFLGVFELPIGNIRREKFNEKYMNIWELTL